MNASGRQLGLAAGDYRAVVTEVGASLRSLTYRGRDVTLGYAEDVRMQLHRGGLLAPWPNRIGDGKYTFEGTEYQVAVNEVARMNALHGLVNWQAWAVESQTESAAVLTMRVWPQPGYDFMVDMRVAYTLAESGLTIELTATNAGTTPAPYGGSIHPYLVAGDGTVDDWTMTVPATRVVDADPVRLLPVGTTSALAGTPLDFSSPRVVGATEIDHCMTGITALPDGRAVARVVGPDGRGAEIEWSVAECPWVQVHTADRPEVENNRRGMAIEPMTCPPDAFRTGEGLIALQPGVSTSASWTIRGLA
ncbi:MAG: aldose 1-epimerase [Frankiaceae bacterium]|nr:aldose 1-epimerase [Frankiaceae bacterium]